MNPENQATRLRSSSEFKAAVQQMLKVVTEHSAHIEGVKAGSGPELYKKELESFQADRGRELYYPYLSSGLGRGPYIELSDGSVKMDLITGIGVNFFGHSHPKIMQAVLEGATSDIMHGNLQPGKEVADFTHAMLARVGSKSRLKHLWLTCSGTMANEVALKLVRQKRTPATKILAFRDCFTGRSTAMQEITDNPKYREGQPTYGEVDYLTLFDPELGLQKSIERTVGEMYGYFSKNPGKYAALMAELIQGEGGFGSAPREYWVQIFETAKKSGLYIWLDEIQTFGRTGEFFAYQTFGLEEFVDIVTVGKTLQACCAIYTAELNPKPGLIAGTFVGSTAALRSGKRILEIFDEEKIHGPNGKTATLSRRMAQGLQKLKDGSCKGWIKEIRAIGGMIALMPGSGTSDEVKKVLMSLYDQGYVAFNCGHGPYLLRMLPPFGVMSEAHVDEVVRAVEKSLKECLGGSKV